VQALWVTGDNTAFQGFDAIVRAARDAKLPLIINDPEFVQRGALIAVGIGWYESCGAPSKVLARVLRGEQPRNIPFEEVAVKKLVLNQEVAKRSGLRSRLTSCRPLLDNPYGPSISHGSLMTHACRPLVASSWEP
jgi:putative tryptophan/tyrosine transport system substrate-binding protein